MRHRMLDEMDPQQYMTEAIEDAYDVTPIEDPFANVEAAAEEAYHVASMHDPAPHELVTLSDAEQRFLDLPEDVTYYDDPAPKLPIVVSIAMSELAAA